MQLPKSLPTFAPSVLRPAILFAAAAPCAAQFQYDMNLATGPDSSLLEMVDVDSDGDLDMIVPSVPSQTVRILWNDGLGRFPDSVTVPVPFTHNPFGAAAVAVGDMNGDCMADIVIAGTDDGWVLLADGSGAYVVSQVSGWLGGGVHPLYLLDIENDGDLDVMTWRRLLLNDGSGAFNMGTLPAGANTSRAIAFADLDLDGDVDIAAAFEVGNDTRLEFYPGDGAGGFGAPLSQTFSYREPESLEVQDFTGDGIPDLILGYVSDTRWRVLRGDGSGAFVPSTGYTIGEYFVVGDFNGDGVQDVVYQDWMYYLYGKLSDGSGGFTTEWWYDVHHGGLQDAADLDGDGLAEVLFAPDPNGAPPTRVVVYSNQLASRDWRASPVNGHWYRVIPARDWISAEQEAVTLGGHLATIRSAAENDWLATQFDGPHSMGFTDVYNEGQWGWTSGEPVTFEGWAVGQPDDLGDSDAGIWHPDGWRDEPLGAVFPAIVELESDDCDQNGVPDVEDVRRGWAEDINGDGVLDSCVAPYYCYSTPNSSGVDAEITFSGAPAVGVDTVHLTVAGLPQNRFGYFLMSDSQGFTLQVGGGQGSLCLGLPFVRFAGDVLNSGAGGVMSYTPDLVHPPGGVAVSQGETWNFQCWFRDQNPGPTSNLSSAVSLTLSVDPRPTASFTTSCSSIEEQATQLIVFVELSWAYPQDVSVPFTVSGSATHQVDWRVESSNPLLVPAGQTSVPVLITVAEDAAAEPYEVGRIELSASPTARPGPQATYELGIRDDD